MKPERVWAKFLELIHLPGLYRDAGLLAAATMISGLGSLVYWKIITLRFSAEMVGLVSVGIASATFLGGLSNIGLTSGLVRFLPNREPAEKRSLIGTADFLSFLLALLISVIFLSGRQWWAPNLVPPQAGDIYLPIFVTLLISCTQLNLNVAVIQAERRIQYLIGQNSIINIIQIAGGLLVAMTAGVTGILFTYMLPILIVAIGFIWLFPRVDKDIHSAHAIDRQLLKEVLRYSFSSQVFSIVWSLPTFIFPLMTLKLLGAEATAGLAITWFAYSFIIVIPNAISVALLVSGSHEPENLRKNAWGALRIDMVILIPLLIVIIILAPLLLGFFGAIYVRSVMLLRLMTLSILPVSINSLYLTLLRTRKRMQQLNTYVSSLILGSIAISYVLIGFVGLNGIGLGWLAGQTLFSSVALILLVRERRPNPEEMI